MAKDIDSEKNVWTPPVAFYFKVEFHGKDSIPNTSFSEVSGISTELETEPLKEGGENNFVHNLPLRLKQGRLTLKRALEPMENRLEKWIRDNLEGGFSGGFNPLNLSILLMNSAGEPLAQWMCNNVFPLKWEISSLDARKNELVIETLELSYNTITRGK